MGNIASYTPTVGRTGLMSTKQHVSHPKRTQISLDITQLYPVPSQSGNRESKLPGWIVN